MNSHDKLVLACNVGLFTEKAKFFWMALAVGGYLLKMPEAALSSTTLCFVTVIAEAIAHSYIFSGEWEE